MAEEIDSPLAGGAPGVGSPMACDIDSGACLAPQTSPPPAPGERPAGGHADGPASGTATALYVTDPICSGCWAFEPALRKLRHHYADALIWRNVYGGLLPGWHGFSDPGAGIAAPADVAPHWAQVAAHTGQPINPGVWLADPPSSSYPASKAAHIARMLDPAVEEAYLRRLREAVFLEQRNIARHDVLADCAREVGLDRRAFAVLLEADAGAAGLAADLREARALRARAFPTLILSGPQGPPLALTGARPFPQIEAALRSVLGDDARRSAKVPSAREALSAYGGGTLLELAVLLELDLDAAAAALAAAGATRLAVGDADYWLAEGGERAAALA